MVKVVSLFEALEMALNGCLGFQPCAIVSTTLSVRCHLKIRATGTTAASVFCPPEMRTEHEQRVCLNRSSFLASTAEKQGP